MEITLTNENFEEEVLNSDVPVLVDFWAVWCMPCKMLAPIVEELANEANGAYKVGKVNVDEAPELAAPIELQEFQLSLFSKMEKFTKNPLVLFQKLT